MFYWILLLTTIEPTNQAISANSDVLGIHANQESCEMQMVKHAKKYNFKLQIKDQGGFKTLKAAKNQNRHGFDTIDFIECDQFYTDRFQ